MATLKELREARLHKLEQLKNLGIDAYPAISKKDFSNKVILDKFEELDGKEVSVTGKIFSIRGHGKLSFIDIKDASSMLQLVLKETDVLNADYKYSELNFSDLHLLDTGDFVEATGKVFKTQRGEKSIEVTKIRILTKSLRPMPDAWDGLKDKETRMRRRYLDTTINQEVFERFIRRAKFWEATRMFLRDRGFYEINVPVLEQIPGGADANPFITHMDAIDQDFFLRISHELQLKRLIGGGYEKVYEIGPRFRNEGLSDEHLPEHMAMEFYWAYASWTEGMEMIKDMFNYVIKYVYGDKKVFSIKGYEVDFSKDWEIIDFNEIMKERYGLDIHNCALSDVEAVFKKEKLPMKECVNVPRAVDVLWKQIRKTIVGPSFLINHPK
jgi:lysyl-tRNA synthetase class 2